MEKKIGTLIKVITSKRKINDTCTYDSLLLIYRDENGEKKTQFIDRAEVPFYVINDKESEDAISPPMFIEREKVSASATYTDLLYREIAVKTDSLHYYDRVLTNYGPGSYSMKNLFKHNYLYDTDMDYADRYIAKFHEDFKADENYKLHKCYFDIEVDLMEHGWKKDAKGNVGHMGFPDEEVAPVPVNVITIYDEKAKELHTFVVRNPANKTIAELEANIDQFEGYMTKKLMEEDLVVVNDMNFYFFDHELECIEAFFKKVHDIDPDFMLA